MKIIGFNLTKISGEKKEKQPEKLNITQNIDIIELKEDEISISDKKSLNIKFNFLISYSEDFAKMEFEGTVVILPQDKEIKDIMDSWKDKKLPEDFRIPLFNFIMNKCNVKALTLEDEMGLPIHLPLPRVTSQQDSQV
jgi:hypothetical protein